MAPARHAARKDRETMAYGRRAYPRLSSDPAQKDDAQLKREIYARVSEGRDSPSRYHPL